MRRIPVLLALAVTLASAAPAHADDEREPSGPLRLRSAPCAPATLTGAELRCTLDGRRLPRPASYFEQHAALVQRDMLFFQHTYSLADMRERDTLRLYGPTPGGASAVAGGIALFGGVVVGAAHAPGAARALFDHRRLHVGPALFDGGGMGAGVGGRL